MPRSTFYYQRKVALAGDRDAELKSRISASYHGHRGRYGYRRITADIASTGPLVNKKAVQRVMAQLGLKSLVRPKKYKSYKGEIGEASDNHLQRKFSAEQPNEKWVTDVTEFKVAGEKLYLSPVMDLHNGEIIAYTMHTRPAFSLVTSMITAALKTLPPGVAPMIHSDQGWHYRMEGFRKTLRQNGMKQSMSAKGCCYDNAAMESFFGVLKTEYFYLNKFSSVDELRAGIDEYIHYYNNDRIKKKLGWLSPVQYRTRHANRSQVLSN